MLTQRIIDRVTLIARMTRAGLDLSLTQGHSQENLTRCVERLEEYNIGADILDGNINIQNELAANEGFAGYLAAILKNEPHLPALDGLIAELREQGGNITNYSMERVSETLSLPLDKGLSGVYLKNFSHAGLDAARRELVCDNLNAVQTPGFEMTEEEKALILEPYIAAGIVSADSFAPLCVLFRRDPQLKEIAALLYAAELRDLDLPLSAFEGFHKAADEVLGGLTAVFGLLGSPGLKNDFMERWAENDWEPTDLRTLKRKLPDMTKKRKEAALSSRSAYVNLICGERLKDMKLSGLHPYQENLLIYAITRGKKAFLRLAEEHSEKFLDLSSNSILFSEPLYKKHLNLNELNAKNLDDCFRMFASEFSVQSLEAERVYTFGEIKTLYGFPAIYTNLYNKLSSPRIDERLLILRQLTKRGALAGIEDEHDLSVLADKLNKKPLSRWMEGEFGHIPGLKARNAASLLVYYDALKDFVSQARTPADIMLLIRNRDDVDRFDTLAGMKRGVHTIDPAWKRMISVMGFGGEFLSKYESGVIEFLCRNGAQIAMTYFDGVVSDAQRESLKRVVKAELMGGIRTLKYYGDDLSAEVAYPVGAEQKEAWAENLEISGGDFTVREHDDFFAAIQMGVTPMRTCLSYIDGEYKECLLSAFDANKKVLYAYRDGAIAGRAILRLTKGRVNVAVKTVPALSFVDLENMPEPDQNTREAAQEERLTVFLERSYTVGLSPEQTKRIMTLFAEFAGLKADRLNAAPVLSRDYEEVKPEGYARAAYCLYISRSKAGAQYLDSLNGHAGPSDEGGYRSNTFFIRRDEAGSSGDEQIGVSLTIK